MLHVNGEMVSYGDGGLRLFYYATELFGDFTLRLQFRIFDATKHNSGVFLRFPRRRSTSPAPSCHDEQLWNLRSTRATLVEAGHQRFRSASRR